MIALPGLRVPYEQLTTSLATARRSEVISIGVPYDARDCALVSRQPVKQRALGGVPHIDDPIGASTSDQSCVRAPCYVADPGWEGLLGPPILARRQVPYQQTMVVCPGSKLPTVRAQRQSIEEVARILVVLQNFCTGSGHRIP